MASSTPGTNGTLKDLTACFAFNLSPMTSIEAAEGPINLTPIAFSLFANSAFSDKKP